MTRHLTDEELLLDFYDEGTAVDRTLVRTHLAQCEGAGHSIRSCAPC